MRLFFPALLLCLMPAACAAGLDSQVLAAAAAGKTAEVETLLSQGAPLEAHDKDGRTPLMLAAQRGHEQTVRLLLAKGARADARDNSGFTAYGLALLDPVGKGAHPQVLQALPQPVHPRISMDAIAWPPLRADQLLFHAPGQLKQQVTNLGLDNGRRREGDCGLRPGLRQGNPSD